MPWENIGQLPWFWSKQNTWKADMEGIHLETNSVVHVNVSQLDFMHLARENLPFFFLMMTFFFLIWLTKVNTFALYKHTTAVDLLPHSHVMKICYVQGFVL